MPLKKNVPTSYTEFRYLISPLHWNYRPKADETIIIEKAVENKSENSDYKKNWNYRPEPEGPKEPEAPITPEAAESSESQETVEIN